MYVMMIYFFNIRTNISLAASYLSPVAHLPKGQLLTCGEARPAFDSFSYTRILESDSL
jgi:hypothetical protein